MAKEHGPPFCWSPPVLEERRFKLPPSFGGRRLLLGVDGNWTNADIYVRVPASWVDVRLSLVLRQEFMNLPVAEALIGDADHPTIAQGLFEGLVLSVRGRPIFGRLNVFAERPVAPIGEIEREGFLLINAWGQEGAAQSDQAGRQIVDHFAPHAAKLQSTQEIPVGAPSVATIFAAQANRRIYVTNLSYTTSEATRRALTIESPTGTVQLRYIVSPDFPIIEKFDPPLRTARGAEWVARSIIAGNNNGLNVGGFVE